jgi:hypothetical protein
MDVKEMESDEGEHITGPYLLEIHDKKQELSEADIAHIAECEQCGRLLTEFLKRYIEPSRSRGHR